MAKPENDKQFEQDFADVFAEEEFEVEKILNVGYDENWDTMYLVKWRGYDDSYNLWLPHWELERNCYDAILEFYQWRNENRDKLTVVEEDGVDINVIDNVFVVRG